MHKNFEMNHHSQSTNSNPVLPSSDLKYFSTLNFLEKLKKVCKTIKEIKSFAEQVLKSFSGRNNFLEPSVFIFTKSLPYILKESRKLRIFIS